MSDEAKIILKDMQIEEMRKEIISQDQFIAQLEKEYEQEIKRLNNIINELEKCFEKTWQNYKDSESEVLYAIAIENKNYLYMLQELKGEDKE